MALVESVNISYLIFAPAFSHLHLQSINYSFCSVSYHPKFNNKDAVTTNIHVAEVLMAVFSAGD